MSAFLDIILSAAFAGFILLLVLGLNEALTETASQNNLAMIAQHTLWDITRLVEYDFHKIGYKASGIPIVQADSISITFAADIDSTTAYIDTVQYSLGEGLTKTPNPRDRRLTRIVNTDTSRFGVSHFQLTYYDSLGSKTSTLSMVQFIKVAITYETPDRYGSSSADSSYPGAHWEKIIGLRNR